MPNAGTQANLREIIESIRLMKRLEGEGRSPTELERRVLQSFTGFGALANEIWPRSGSYSSLQWGALVGELKELLTTEEFKSAEATTYSAFYTSPLVMGVMNEILGEAGLDHGDVGLEPGCGIGRFIGADVWENRFIGVERDLISGRIARLLYPDHDIRIESFDDSPLLDGSVDYAVGNVPFGDVPLRYRGREWHSLHDFFMLKSLDLIRPGGLACLVTSQYTMNSKLSTVRRLMAEKAEFAGAIMLPGNAFKQEGTKVATVVMLFRKHPYIKPKMDLGKLEKPEKIKQIPSHDWFDTKQVGEVYLNQYFIENPQMVVGEVSSGPGMHGPHTLLVDCPAEQFEERLRAAASLLPEGVMTDRPFPLSEMVEVKLDDDLPPGMVESSIFVRGNALMQVVGGKAAPMMRGEMPITTSKGMVGRRLAGLVELRDLAKEVVRVQEDKEPDDVREAARSRLRWSYGRFVSKYGPVNEVSTSKSNAGRVSRRLKNLSSFKSDPDAFLVSALENYDERANTGVGGDLMHEDVIPESVEVSRVGTAKEALIASLNYRADIDFPLMERLYERKSSQIIAELQRDDLIFYDPSVDRYVIASDYLSGDVRSKLVLARECSDARAKGNIAALEAAQPDDVPPGDIKVNIGTPWIPEEVYKEFIRDGLGINTGRVTVKRNASHASWKVDGTHVARTSVAAKKKFGTDKCNALTLMQLAFDLRRPKIRQQVPNGLGGFTTAPDPEATVLAEEKLDLLQQTFSDWIFADDERRDAMVELYNTQYNFLSLPKFDGSHQRFPGLNRNIKLHPHQKNAVWRNILTGNTMLAHVVGAGKTFTMIAAGMEMKRMGLVNRPVYTVPNCMLEQFAREFRVLYPGAKILVATKDDLSEEGRARFKMKVKSGNWDGVVMTHSSFEKIPMSPEFQERFLTKQLAEYEEVLEASKNTGAKDFVGEVKKSMNRLVKQRAKLRDKAENRLKQMSNKDGKDDGLTFENLGFDWVFCDEGHMFKNLLLATKMNRIAGVPNGGSYRAFDLFMKAQYLDSKTPGRGLTMATGTPVTNSLAEMYTMMRFLAPRQLEKMGLLEFDNWAALYGRVVEELELKPSGKGLRTKDRFSRFVNVAELLTLFHSFSDVQTQAMIKLKVPAVKGGKPTAVVSKLSDLGRGYQGTLVDRYEAILAGNPDKRMNKKGHMTDDIVLNVCTDGRLLAIDERLVDPKGRDYPDSKVNALASNVRRIYDESEGIRGTQLVFCDMGVNPTSWGLSFYDEMVRKFVESGVPRDEIGIIGDATNDAQIEAMKQKVREGRIRVLIGSTGKMGVGMNVQDRLVGLHHVDALWRPADLEQRDGRGIRQRPKGAPVIGEVEIVRYLTEGSFDAYMWQTLERKARFISQAMREGTSLREMEDIGGDAVFSYAEMKAIASGNPGILVLAQMEMDIKLLEVKHRAHRTERINMQSELRFMKKTYDSVKAELAEREVDHAAGRFVDTRGKKFSIEINGTVYSKGEKDKKGKQWTVRQVAYDPIYQAIRMASKQLFVEGDEIAVGKIGGFDIVVARRGRENGVYLKGDGAGYRVGRYSKAGDKGIDWLARLEMDVRAEGTIDSLRRQVERYEKEIPDVTALLEERNPIEKNIDELKPLRYELERLLSEIDGAGASQEDSSKKKSRPKLKDGVEAKPASVELVMQMERERSEFRDQQRERAEEERETRIDEISERYKEIMGSVKDKPTIERVRADAVEADHEGPVGSQDGLELAMAQLEGVPVVGESDQGGRVRPDRSRRTQEGLQDAPVVPQEGAEQADADREQRGAADGASSQGHGSRSSARPSLKPTVLGDVGGGPVSIGGQLGEEAGHAGRRSAPGGGRKGQMNLFGAGNGTAERAAPRSPDSGNANGRPVGSPVTDDRGGVKGRDHPGGAGRPAAVEVPVVEDEPSSVVEVAAAVPVVDSAESKPGRPSPVVEVAVAVPVAPVVDSAQSKPDRPSSVVEVVGAAPVVALEDQELEAQLDALFDLERAELMDGRAPVLEETDRPSSIVEGVSAAPVAAVLENEGMAQEVAAKASVAIRGLSDGQRGLVDKFYASGGPFERGVRAVPYLSELSSHVNDAVYDVTEFSGCCARALVDGLSFDEMVVSVRRSSVILDEMRVESSRGMYDLIMGFRARQELVAEAHERFQQELVRGEIEEIDGSRVLEDVFGDSGVVFDVAQYCAESGIVPSEFLLVLQKVGVFNRLSPARSEKAGRAYAAFAAEQMAPKISTARDWRMEMNYDENGPSFVKLLEEKALDASRVIPVLIEAIERNLDHRQFMERLRGWVDVEPLSADEGEMVAKGLAVLEREVQRRVKDAELQEGPAVAVRSVLGQWPVEAAKDEPAEAEKRTVHKRSASLDSRRLGAKEPWVAKASRTRASPSEGGRLSVAHF